MDTDPKFPSADRFVASLDEGLCLGDVLNHPFLRTGPWNTNGNAGCQLATEVEAMSDLVLRTLVSLGDIDGAESGRVNRIPGVPIAIHALLGVLENLACVGRPARIGALYVLHTVAVRLSEIVCDSIERASSSPAGGADEHVARRTNLVRTLIRSQVLAAPADVLQGVQAMSLAIGRYWGVLQSMQRAGEPSGLVQP